MACSGGCGTGGGCTSGGCSSGGCESGGCSTCPAAHAYDWLADLGVGGATETGDIVEVSFKGGRRGFYRNSGHLDIETGDYVIVEADRGTDFGMIHMRGELVRLRLKSNDREDPEALPQVVRKARLKDINRWEANKERETETFLVGRQMVDRMNLPMKIADVEWQFDGKKVTFYFTAERRVDFRQLVRKLAGKFRTRVELRQIGVRDEAARLGGIGSCGRELCCSTWLQEFKPVSTQAAKVQDLPLNPVRLSGQCGRLKCCLNYELEQYMKALKAFPKVGTHLVTDRGKARIQKLDIFKNLVWLLYEDSMWDSMPLAEVKALIRNKPAKKPPGKKKQGNRK